jgi:hypothetical protein
MRLGYCDAHGITAIKFTGKETSDFSETHTFRFYYLAICYGPDGLGFAPMDKWLSLLHNHPE